MLRKIALIALIFSFVIAGGCSSKVPSLQDELKDIDHDLQWVMEELEFAIEQCEELEGELRSISAAFGSRERANMLRKQLLKLQEDIGNAESKLYNIVWRDE